MKLRFTFLIFFISILSIYGDKPEGYSFKSFNQALSDSAKDGRAIFIYYGRVGCGFCEMTNKKVFSKKDIQKLFQSSFHLVYLDSESGNRITLPSGEVITERQLGEKMNVLGTPVFLVMTADGKLISRLNGMQTDESFRKLHEYVQSGKYDLKKLPLLLD
jgi:thioredoxin-related protein